MTTGWRIGVVLSAIAFVLVAVLLIHFQDWGWLNVVSYTLDGLIAIATVVVTVALCTGQISWGRAPAPAPAPPAGGRDVEWARQAAASAATMSDGQTKMRAGTAVRNVAPAEQGTPAATATHVKQQCLDAVSNLDPIAPAVVRGMAETIVPDPGGGGGGAPGGGGAAPADTRTGFGILILLILLVMGNIKLLAVTHADAKPYPGYTRTGARITVAGSDDTFTIVEGTYYKNLETPDLRLLLREDRTMGIARDRGQIHFFKSSNRENYETPPGHPPSDRSD